MSNSCIWSTTTDFLFSSDDLVRIVYNIDKTMLDPEFAHSQELEKSTFHKTFNAGNEKWYQWLARPKNLWRRRRFSAGMKGLTQIQPLSLICNISLAP